MIGNKENIFSWRPELKQLTRQQRSNWFYEQKVISQLSDDVNEAEQARINHNHDHIQTLFDAWTVRNKTGELAVYKKVQARYSSKESLSNNQHNVAYPELLALGLAGLTLIEHVGILNSKAIHASDDSATELLSEIDSIYDELNYENLPAETIHGGGIHWLSEVAQATASTYKNFGSMQEATEELEFAIEQIELEWQTLNDQSIGEIGKQYAYAVLTAKLGRLTGNFDLIITGLESVMQAYTQQPNTHRLATLSKWGLTAALKPSLRLQPIKRVDLLYKSLRGLTQAVKDDWKTALKTFRPS